VRQLVASLIVALVAGLAFWFLAPSRERPVGALPPELDGEPDLYMRAATITQHLTDGSVQYVLRSDRILSFDANGLTRLAEPRLTLYSPTAPPAHARSVTGTIRRNSNDEEVVELRDDVVMERAGANGEYMIVRAPGVDLYPDRQYVESDHGVIIESSFGRSRSQGIRSDLKAGLVSLTSSGEQRVHTVILPARGARGASTSPAP
jgi:LPS export ABC transporter protein LptC